MKVEHVLSLLPFYSLGVYSSSTLKTVKRALKAIQHQLHCCSKKIMTEGVHRFILPLILKNHMILP
jgi:hypothetical protein